MYTFNALKCPNCGSTNIEYSGSSNAGVAICKDCRTLVAKFPSFRGGKRNVLGRNRGLQNEMGGRLHTQSAYNINTIKALIGCDR